MRALGHILAFSHRLDASSCPACRLKTDPTDPLQAVESYQEGADLLSQARWVAQPAAVVARSF